MMEEGRGGEEEEGGRGGGEEGGRGREGGILNRP